MPIASRSSASSSDCVTITTAMAGSMARISGSRSRPRRPGICSSSSTTLYGWRRSIASASSPCAACATANPCSSRKRRCAARPSISSSTQRMLFGRGILRCKLVPLAKPGNARLHWPRVAYSVRPVQLHRRRSPHHSPRARVAPAPSRRRAVFRHQAGDGAAGRRKSVSGPGHRARAERANHRPRPPAAGPPANPRARSARQPPQCRAAAARPVPMGPLLETQTRPNRVDRGEDQHVREARVGTRTLLRGGARARRAPRRRPTRVFSGARGTRARRALAHRTRPRPATLRGARPRRRARDQALADSPLDRTGRAAAKDGIRTRGGRWYWRPRARRPSGFGRSQRGRRVYAAGNGGLSRPRHRARLRRHGGDAHGNGCRHARGRALRADGRAVRFLSVREPRGGARARSRLPSVFGDGDGTLPTRSPSLPRGNLPRSGGCRGAATRRVTTPAEEKLVTLIARSARGPQREGLFALWLVVRAAEALLPPAPVSAKNHRRRLQALETRIGSLALPGPLKRALAAARQHLESATPNAAALVLSQLTAPAREVLGVEAGDAVTVAARTARLHL